jgi:hypothetical protein
MSGWVDFFHGIHFFFGLEMFTNVHFLSFF